MVGETVGACLVYWAAGTSPAALCVDEKSKAGQALQWYMVENMMYPSVTTLPFIQAMRTHVKGYESLHGFKIRFETPWLDKQ